jgi:hypothetical protein
VHPLPPLGYRPGAATALPWVVCGTWGALTGTAGRPEAVGGAAPQTAGAEVMEAVQQARALVLRVAQGAHEREATGGVQGARAFQRREDCSRHLLEQYRTRLGDHGAGPVRSTVCAPAAPPATLPPPSYLSRRRSVALDWGVARDWDWGPERREQRELAGNLGRPPVGGSEPTAVALPGKVRRRD